MSGNEMDEMDEVDEVGHSGWDGIHEGRCRMERSTPIFQVPPVYVHCDKRAHARRL